MVTSTLGFFGGAVKGLALVGLLAHGYVPFLSCLFSSFVWSISHVLVANWIGDADKAIFVFFA